MEKVNVVNPTTLGATESTAPGFLEEDYKSDQVEDDENVPRRIVRIGNFDLTTHPENAKWKKLDDG